MEHPCTPLNKDDGAPSGEPARAADAGASSRTVIREESFQENGIEGPTLRADAAITDWLNVTFPYDPDKLEPAQFLERFSFATDGIFGAMTDTGKGLQGWKVSFRFDRGAVFFALGGQRGTALLSMAGEGCAFVRDWPRLTHFLRDELSARITRWDGAADDYHGKHSVDLAAELYLLDGFNAGGRRPSCNQHGNWLTPDEKGRTFEVGRRQNGKILRVYEKGKQLGCPLNPWVRWEVELHNVDREIPWDVLERPGDYIAGAYPCMTWVQDRASRIRTIKTQDAITYARLTSVASLSYGALVEVMLAREGSAERVVQLLRRDGVPKRLAFTDDFLKTVGENDAL